jgi:hypothetical protein
VVWKVRRACGPTTFGHCHRLLVRVDGCHAAVADNFGLVSDIPRFPGLKLAEADWLVQAALAVGAERSCPPLAVAVVDVSGEVIVLRRADGGMPMTSRHGRHRRVLLLSHGLC